jgi:hypothetical protein
MAVVLIATPGAANANTYATLSEANTYHESHVASAAWDAATDDQKNRALVQATRELDAYLLWDGFASSTTQALAWPRTGLSDPDTGASVSGTTLPDRLIYATSEQARLLLAGDRAAELDQQAQGLKALTAGSVSLEFKDDAAPRQVVASSAFQFVAAWCRVKQAALGGPIPLIRV